VEVLNNHIVKLGSLFSGRGGFEIGAEACGIEVAFTCEIDPFLRRKLKNLYPYATHYFDVRDVRFSAPPTSRIDILAAGFPCQDISVSNRKNQQGIRGHRSGLWSEVARIANEIKPAYIVFENSPNLLCKGFEYVLRDLSTIGYDAEWDCWRAADFGFPHNRLRLYAIAYPGRDRRRGGLLKPPGTYDLSRSWTPTPSYLRCTSGRANGFRDITSIQRGDVVPDFASEIKAFGNAVMPAISEHLFKCIIDDFNKQF
jgi:DNA (cytosine-5)-methyltransferase 1